MKKIKIITKTAAGFAALMQHVKESDRLIVKWSLKKLSIRQVLDGKTLILEYNAPEYALLPLRKFKQAVDKNIDQIHDAMKDNGATKKDYNIGVVDE